MMPLHPAPADAYRADHRETPNREQMAVPSDMLSFWKRTVEGVAEELQIEPIDAHFYLMRCAGHMTKGLAWEWWLHG